MTNHPNRSNASRRMRDAAPELLAALKILLQDHDAVSWPRACRYAEYAIALAEKGGPQPIRPDQAIDHIDGDPRNNDTANLRIVTVARNRG